MQKDQEGLTIASNLQRSMHFRRRASKEMRANSAKWTKNSSTIKNQGGAISHKSPIATRKLIDKSLDKAAAIEDEQDDNMAEKLSQDMSHSPHKEDDNFTKPTLNLEKQKRPILAQD